MVKIQFILGSLLFCFSLSSAQKQNNIWCFGDSAGIDFNFNPPHTFTSQCNTRGSAASIADTAGNLVLYTAETPWGTYSKRTRVFNSQSQIIQNGDSIVGLGWYREHIILPFPGHPNLYYLFSLGVTTDFGLYYSLIDMTQNGGLGAVTQKNMQLLSFEVTDGLQAIKHGNGRDWWIICRKCDNTSNEHYLYLISPSGVSAPYVQTIGTPSFYNTTRLDFSPDGNKLAEVNFAGLLEIFNFDRCTGTLSNLRTINQENNPWVQFVCSEFSLNQDILYLSVNDYTSYLIQLNLLEPDPWAIHDTLWALNSTHDSGGLLELAPDGKIYYSCDWYDGVHFNYPYPDSAYYLENMNLGIVNYPDSLGTSCFFQPYGFNLGGSRTYFGLPNNPNYALPADTTSLCDSLSVGIAQTENTDKDLKLFYHSGWQTTFINASGLQGESYSLTIFDITGKQLFSEQGNLFSEYFTKDLLCNFADGIYILSLVTEREKLTGRFIVQ